MKNKESILAEIEAMRPMLHQLIDDRFDAMRAAILGGETIEPQEHAYPLSFSPYFFKGKKPIAILFGEERVEVRTWQKVYAEILHRCNAEKHEVLMELRGKISGRDRTILSARAEGMTRSLKLAEDMFVETFYDTQGLIYVLTKRILDAVGYDYGNISVVLKP